MHAAPLAAAGVLAHAVHLGLILLGTAGVLLLLAPGWRASRAARRTPTGARDDAARLDELRAREGTPRPLGDSR